MKNKSKGHVSSEYLAAAKTLFEPIKKRSYRLLGALENKSVLDIGCGPGLDTLALAKLVGKNGTVNGVDYDDSMIQEAESRAKKENLSDKAVHQIGNAYELPFADNYFDGVRSERLFIHLSHPEQALAEAIRVTKPGGRVVIIDTDWGSLSAHSGVDSLERRLTRFLAEDVMTNGYSGRRLFGQLQTSPLENVQLETIALHTTELPLWLLMTQFPRVVDLALTRQIIDDTERQTWDRSLEEAAERNIFYGGVNIAVAYGNVPLI